MSRGLRSDRWVCPHCQHENSSDSTVCEKCLGKLIDAGRDAVVREHLEKARAFEAEGRIEQAIVQLQQAARADQENFEVCARLGQLYLRRGATSEAIAELEHALRLRSTDPSAHYALGLALKAAGRLEEAGARIAAAVQLDPTDAEASSALEELKNALVEAGLPEIEERAPPPPPAPPRVPILGWRTLLAFLASALAAAGSTVAAAFAFNWTTSPQLTQRVVVYQQYESSAFAAIAFFCGLAASRARAPLLPVGAFVSGLLAGGPGMWMMRSLCEVALGRQLLLSLAVGTGLLAASVEFLLRSTVLADNRSFFLKLGLALVALYLAATWLRQGALHGRVIREISSGAESRTAWVGGANVFLVSTQRPELMYYTRSFNASKRPSNKSLWQSHGTFNFRNLAVGEYVLSARDARTGQWTSEKVNVEYAIVPHYPVDIALPPREVKPILRSGLGPS
jgi:hypothetical protein